MNATFAPTAAPPWAATMWSDDHAIYIEFPVKGGPPYVTEFPLSEGGLAKALYTMRSLHQKLAPVYTGDRPHAIAKPPRHPMVKTKSVGESYTDAQRENAREVLRKLRLIG